MNTSLNARNRRTSDYITHVVFYAKRYIVRTWIIRKPRDQLSAELSAHDTQNFLACNTCCGFLAIYRLNYSNGPTGRTTTEGSSMSVLGMGCWNTVLGTGQQLGKANFKTLDAY